MQNIDEKDLQKIFEKDGQYTFLVGAGVSMNPPSNLPSALEIAHSLIELCAPENEIDIIKSMENLRYEYMISEIRLLFDNDLKLMDYFELAINPNLIHFFLAYMIKSMQWVVTTNFDNLIEYALLSIGDFKYPVLNIITKEDFTKYAEIHKFATLGNYIICKIHGSKKNVMTGEDISDSLVTTMESLGKEKTKGETFAIEAYKKSLVDNLMKDRILVVMGYSGSDDFDIGPLLKELHGLKGLIWIEHSNQKQIFIKKYMKNDAFSQNNKMKFEQLLSEIAKTAEFNVIQITSNTNLLIELLFKYFFPDISIPKLEIISEMPKFKHWFKALGLPNLEVLSVKYFFAFRLYTRFNDYENALRSSQNGLELAERAQDKMMLSFFYNSLGFMYDHKGDLVKAEALYRKALNFNKAEGFEAKNAVTLNNISEIYERTNRFDEAIKILNEALDLSEKYKIYLYKAVTLSHLGDNYKCKRQFNITLEYHQKALEVSEQHGLISEKARCLNNIGETYLEMGELDKSLDFLKEALKINKLLGIPSEIAICLNNIGGIYSQKKERDKALPYYEEALALHQKVRDPSLKVDTLNNAAIIYMLNKEFDKALEYFREAEAIFEQLGNEPKKREISNVITLILKVQAGEDVSNFKMN